MIWGRRKFAFADYALYQDRLQKLLLANPTRYRQFIMVAVDIEGRTERMYYVGVPDRAFLAGFDGFEIVEENDLPKEIDVLLIAEGSSQEFTSRFRFRDSEYVDCGITISVAPVRYESFDGPTWDVKHHLFIESASVQFTRKPIADKHTDQPTPRRGLFRR